MPVQSTTPVESITNALRRHLSGGRIRSWEELPPAHGCGCQSCARWAVTLTDGQQITLTGYREARAFCHGLASAEQATRPVTGYTAGGAALGAEGAPSPLSWTNRAGGGAWIATNEDHGLASAEQAARPGPKRDDLTFGYTPEQLRDAFDRVKNRANWKLPIARAFPEGISEAERKVIDAAITFHTGSIAEWTETENGLWFVAATGYYAEIGA
jgi:hypothetical protein